MITNSVYGIGYGHKAYRVGAEPDRAFATEFVPTNDPQEAVDLCLACTKEDCPGYCDKMPEVKRRRKYSAKLKEREREERESGKRELDAILEQKELNRTATVAKMAMDGWCESGIARELGLTVGEVKKALDEARKKRFLY